MQTVLVIEDEVYLRRSISQVLDINGYETLVAPDGMVGVEVATQQRPDLIISDVVMPHLDGYGVLEALRNDNRTATIPIILLTSLPPSRSMRQGMVLGAADYLRKPVDIEDLVAAVGAQFDKIERLIQTQESKLDELRRNIVHALPHEMHTPLHQIIGFAQLLAMDTDNGQTRDFAGHILEASSRLEGMIENYLIFAQIDLIASDPQEVTKLRNHIIDDAENIIRDVARNRADQHGRLDDLGLDTQPATLRISRENLTKIVAELVDNAFKFSQPGTPVSVHTSGDEGRIILDICDEGRGMDAAQVKRMGAYMQFDRTLHEQPGVGLGFTLARRLAELHGGDLGINSEPGMGTRVRVGFPII